MNRSEQLSQARSVTVSRSRDLNFNFRLPGDKSISHRSAMIAGLGDGPSRLINYSSARDCQNTIQCLAALGVGFQTSGPDILVYGPGLRGLRACSTPLDAGNSGSTMRMLSGILAGQPFSTTIDGDDSLRSRPMRRIIEPLTRMGASIAARDESFAPLSIEGGSLEGIRYTPPVASAQVKSAVLLAGLFANGTTTIVEITPTRNHTEIMLKEAGLELTIEGEENGASISIARPAGLKPLGDYTVAGDTSSAAFFLVATILADGSQLRLDHIGANPSRTAIIDLLRAMGGNVQVENPRSAHGEPVAEITASVSELHGDMALSGPVIANLIDEIPVLAVAATQMHGRFSVREARELRVKESDRIAALTANLRSMGIRIDEFEDGFELNGPQRLRGAEVDSFGDHRIAMAFAVAGLVADGETTIHNAGAASVSLPEFFDLLESGGASITLR